MNILAKLLCALLLVAATAAQAAISPDEAAAVAQRLSNGRVLAVEKTESGGRPVWRVKVVTPKGDVRVILVDIATGQAL